MNNDELRFSRMRGILRDYQIVDPGYGGYFSEADAAIIRDALVAREYVSTDFFNPVRRTWVNCRIQETPDP